MLFLATLPILRPLVGVMFKPSSLYGLLHCAPQEVVDRKMVICDYHVPFETAASFINSIRRNVPISTPLWLCPVRVPRVAQPLSPHGNYKPGENAFMLNVGIWGRVCDRSAVQYSVALEKEALSLGGRKMLYSSNRYTRGEWDEIFDKGGAYTGMRKRWDAEGRFPHLFEKTCVRGRRSGSEPEEQGWLQLIQAAFADFML